MPFPPFPFAARRFAAVILPPRLFLAMAFGVRHYISFGP
jgi:hypothetical protein